MERAELVATSVEEMPLMLAPDFQLDSAAGEEKLTPEMAELVEVAETAIDASATTASAMMVLNILVGEEDYFLSSLGFAVK